ncbi:ABC transporter substrate-binding protein [Photobacterium swingsii]|uniref:ABC transporter substrate-binding protein n=1 Tax=Photobacterium swingsii TaxID=680026 RepID=UPI003551F350
MKRLMIERLMTFVMSSCLMLISFLAHANWPEWLGDDLQPTASSHWKAEVTEDSVLYSAKQALPRVLVIVSRKATSYDVALKTLLSEYSRELPQAQWVVRKLPSTQVELMTLLKQAESKVNLIYTLGSKATVEVRNVYAGGKLPVISVNAKDPVQLGLIEHYSGSGDNFAFTSLNLPADVVLNFMQRFKPTLKSIGILYANTNRSAYLTQFLPLKRVAEQAGIKIVPIAVDETMADLKLDAAMSRGIQQLQADDPQLAHSVLWLTGSSSLLSRVDEINQYSKKLALISAVPDVVNQTEHSALMSFGVSFVNNAHQAAIYGLQVIKGEIDVGQLPVGVISPPDIAISFQQAKRINQQVPFVLMEMASDVYGVNGTVIRLDGKPVKER